MRVISICLLSLLASLPVAAQAAEYFVSTQGNDAADGLSSDTAFATIQHGVNALEPGDILTIQSGEYFESVRREDMGSSEADTVIRAAIPGTVLLRGDVPAPEFRKVDGYRYIYVADFDGNAQVVNELDTLKVIEAVPNIDELEFMPGLFHHDRDAGKLYLSTPDLGSPKGRRYTISVSGDHGLYLRNAQRVIIEGIAVTGFNSSSFIDHREGTQRGTFGIILVSAKDSVIRDCHAYLNGRGIATSSAAASSGDNVIERCVAWSNASRYGGRSGGLTIFNGRRDVIRDSVSFHNGLKGINIRGGGISGQDEQNASRIVGSLAWGNPAGDFKIKTGHDHVHATERNVGMFPTNSLNPSYSLFGRGAQFRSADTIVLSEEEGLDPDREFADPDNHDYRLQSTSRFRGAGPDGSDQGPFPYEANIYYASPQGDDAADGLSIDAAWRTLEHAASELEPGDTLYLKAGVYEGGLRLSTGAGDAKESIAIRGRGTDRVVIDGPVEIDQSSQIEFERLTFAGDVTVRNSRGIRFHNTRFTTSSVSLQASGVEGLRVTHSEFTGFATAAIGLHESSNTFLSGNIFDNAHGAAVRSDTADAILYSDYNSYRTADEAWMIGGAARSVAELQTRFDRYSQTLTPQYRRDGDELRLSNAQAFAFDGPRGTPLGIYIPRERHAGGDGLRIDPPMVHSVSATTANLEWWSSRPAVFRVHWGSTPEMENSQTLDVVTAYHALKSIESFNTFSLNGLDPNTRYFFQIEFVGLVDDDESTPVDFEGEVISFITASHDPEPRTLYVAADGDNSRTGFSRSEAWRTINHAANHVRPGDTVLIGEGVYHELVRIRTTGDAGARITFKAHPGEKVILDGNEKQLQGAFTAINHKDHLDFDGFYVREFSRGSMRLGVFGLVRSNDIRITRIFHDGRGAGASAELITASHVDNLLVKNSVSIAGWDSIGVGASTHVRIENNVFIRPSIRTVPVTQMADRQDVQVRNNIMTDSLAVKKHVQLIAHTIMLENNCFFLRWPETERSVFGKGGRSLAEYNEAHGVESGNFVTDPGFATFESEPQDENEGLFADSMMPRFNDFPDVFASNPDLVARDIGLQREAFQDFHFHRQSVTSE